MGIPLRNLMNTSPRREHVRLGALYVCYLSLDDPLVHTQVIAYLQGLARSGHRMHLLTFEPRRLRRGHREEIRQRLALAGITWHRLRYHKRPSLPATVFDTVMGALYTWWIAWRYRLDALHARSHVPAAMALISQHLAIFRRPPSLIFDVRGLMAEEYEDAGHWTRGSIPFRLTKAVERIAVRRAATVVVLTERVRRDVFGKLPSGTIRVIPCCADLSSLNGARKERDQIRDSMEFGQDPVMVYVGKFGTWYMASEMAAFFVAARSILAGLKFLILTQADGREIREPLERLGVPSDHYRITSASPERVGAFLAASDFGVSFIKPSPSKASSSPTKIGEYLAAGLPVISTRGVGDLDSLLVPDVGVLISEHSERAYREASMEIQRLIADPGAADRCRTLAHRALSLSEVGIPRYDRLYRELAAQRAIANAASGP